MGTSKLILSNIYAGICAVGAFISVLFILSKINGGAIYISSDSKMKEELNSVWEKRFPDKDLEGLYIKLK